MLTSERNISLVYQGLQASLVNSMLTVESYIKWYDIYVVTPSLRTYKLPGSFHQDFEKETGLTAWSDHVPNPEFCLWIAKTDASLEWDGPSLDMIRGRWIWMKET